MPSWSYRNLFEWLLGGGYTPEMSASGTFVLSGAASLQIEAHMAASGAFTLGGSAALTTEIKMAAAGEMVLTGDAALRTGKNAGILSGCGGPVAADCEEWVLRPFQRQT